MFENDERTLSGKVKMGDIVELWKSIVEKYQEDGQCDFCWKFYAPLTELKLNLVRDVLVEPGSDDVNQACCVHVFLLRNQPDDFSSSPNYSTYGNINTVVHSENYVVYFLIKSKEGLNNYNEMPGHPISEGRHETIFKPLRDCINSSILTDICKVGQVTAYRGSYVYDYQDEQYYGLRVNFSQRLTNFDG